LEENGGLKAKELIAIWQGASFSEVMVEALEKRKLQQTVDLTASTSNSETTTATSASGASLLSVRVRLNRKALFQIMF